MVRFPFEETFLARTKLSYVNLRGILADGKRDREGRVNGFVVVERASTCELIFLRNGDPFQAGVVREDDRQLVPMEPLIEEIIRRGDQGEEGRVAYFGARDEQLRMMLATLSAEPHDGLDDLPGRRLFPVLRERGVTGVVEVLTEPCVFHYLCFERGAFQGGYLADDRAGASMGERVRALFEVEPSPRVRVFPVIHALPDQIPTGLLRTYQGFIDDLLDSLALEIGVPDAESALRDGRTRASVQHPLLAAVEDGWDLSEWTARHTPQELKEAVSAWVIEAIALAGERLDIDPAEHISEAAGERRYILREQGFLRSLPWPIAV